jgi:O-acetyl-ADP-ribose deacetylase (regulator of RNase III)
MVKYKKGDVLKAEEDIIAHGVNCMGGFGSGVAGQIAKLYPRAKQYYFLKFNNKGWLPGEVEFISQYDDKIIANCATQGHYLPRGVCHADYSAIEYAMNQVKKYAQDHKLSIAAPKIGAGLAGGDWNIIEPILNKVFQDYDIAIYELE